MKSVLFVWDESKNRTNISKHGVSFEEAKTVFYDDNAVEFYDDPHSEKEERFLMLGLSNTLRLLLVCHCHHEEDGTIRIFSARKATQQEQKEYRRDVP